jgi:uncharacterized protein YoxC
MEDPINYQIKKLEQQLQELTTQWARLTNKGGYIAESIDAEIERINKQIKEATNGN